MGIAESTLRAVEGLNPSYMTVSFNAVQKMVLRPQFPAFSLFVVAFEHLDLLAHLCKCGGPRM